ncbi:MAG: beta-lactamase family protein [Clostridia bacterium]|jgi:CubicO group peptidase (beta-lactamase class C family)|nr:beta-lactamase family protein [Clostridia bacterium]
MTQHAFNLFLEEVEKQNINLYGINIYQHDAVIAKHYLQPDEPRNIYSASKGFAATAIGILIDEGLLSLDDRPVDFFPEHLPNNLNSGYKNLTLSHLLTMSSGHGRGLLQHDERSSISEKDWIRFIFSQPLASNPGDKFMYSSASTYLAGCMAEKVVGAKLIDFVYQRIFRVLDIPYPVWEECPMGHTFAGSRLELKLSDMLKLGVLYLHGGQYNGAHVVSKHWIDTATSYKISTQNQSNTDEKFGYGYQFWMCRYPGIYLAYGLYGQFVIVFAEREAVIATSANEENSQKLLDVIWEFLLPSL